MNLFALANKAITAFAGPLDRNVVIFMLHGVHDDEMEKMCRPPKSSMHIGALKKAIRLMKRYYTIISLDDAVEMLGSRKQWRKKCVVLTFDDSLKSQFLITMPLFEELQVTGTVFVSTEAVDLQVPYWWRRLEYAFEKREKETLDIPSLSIRCGKIDAAAEKKLLRSIKDSLKKADSAQRESIVSMVESQLGVSVEETRKNDPFAQLLTWSELKALHDGGMTIGNHSVTHANLAAIPEEDLRYEITASTRAIKGKCGIETRHFAYPYGEYTEEVRNELIRNGYSSAVTTESPGWNNRMTDPYALRRFTMPADPDKIPYSISGLKEQVRKLLYRK
ncbi:MAG: polysaccharide deacetylase family protein [Candidatus Latescibacteria bacterium]|nr:polysaccharide deacetylase family protein [Candidatus Latescibacterota bacterium]